MRERFAVSQCHGFRFEATKVGARGGTKAEGWSFSVYDMTAGRVVKTFESERSLGINGSLGIAGARACAEKLAAELNAAVAA